MPEKTVGHDSTGVCPVSKGADLQWDRIEGVVVTDWDMLLETEEVSSIDRFGWLQDVLYVCATLHQG